MVKTKKIVKTKEKKMSLILYCGDKTFKATADTFNEVVESIRKESFGSIRTWGVFKLKVGNKTSEFKYTPFQIRRMFNGGGFNRRLLLDRLTTLLR